MANSAADTLAVPPSARNADIYMAVALIGVLALMIIPLPAFLLDIFLAANITIALVILLVCLYTAQPLDFATFPSIRAATLCSISSSIPSLMNRSWFRVSMIAETSGLPDEALASGLADEVSGIGLPDEALAKSGVELLSVLLMGSPFWLGPGGIAGAFGVDNQGQEKATGMPAVGGSSAVRRPGRDPCYGGGEGRAAGCAEPSKV